MWGFEKRKTLVVEMIILLEFMCAQQQGIISESSAAVIRTEPLSFPFSSLADGASSWSGGESLRDKREQVVKDDQTKIAGMSSPTVLESILGDRGKGDIKKDNVSNPAGPSSSGGGASTAKSIKQQTLIIEDRTPANFSLPQPTNNKGESEDDGSDSSTKRPGGDFDELAAERAIIVIAGIAVIIVLYLGIKFALIKRRKVVKRYGRVEASEMDLLDEVEDEEDSDEEEELFDINQQRRS